MSDSNHLALQTKPGSAGEQHILRIPLQCLWRDLRILSIGCAGDNHAVQRFHRPTLIDEIHRQPVEQFGMTRLFRLQAEISCGMQNPPPEELTPRPVNRNAGDQWIALSINQPTGKAEPVRRNALRQ